MAMLENTFCHLRGISRRRELELWQRGITTWDAFNIHIQPQYSLFGGYFSKAPFAQQIIESRSALTNDDIGYFASHLYRQEHFRIALTFPRDTLFLDIETTGLSRYYDYITAIGWSIGAEYGFFVKGQEDTEFRRALSRSKIIVTFNGSLFDLPFIRHEFHDIRLPEVHVDLRFLSRRAGFTGGQKDIENVLGIKRTNDVSEMTGEAAPLLWHRYRRGDIDSLRVLLKYNHADIRGMKLIFDKVARSLLMSYGLQEKCFSIPSFSEFESSFSKDSLEEKLLKVIKPFAPSVHPSVRIDELALVDRYPRLKVVGIDLSGSETRASGWCVLDGHEVATLPLHGDEEIVAQTVKERPRIISIDSPLSLPSGRKTVDDTDPGRTQYGIVRYCERVLKRRGVNVYPALIPSMQKLTDRGIRLANRFRALGFPVIESYPGAAQDILGIPRKRASLEFLERGLVEFGITGAFVKETVSHDELDAITSAIVGVFFWSGMFERLGEVPFGDEGLIIPDLKADITSLRSTKVIGFSGALGVGKTTAAEFLERKSGFAYGRYSQVIQAKLTSKRGVHDRTALQNEGRRINKRYGQRWLGQQLLTKLGASRTIVIDGLRFPEDHAYLTEMFGPQFTHIHLIAPKDIRKARCVRREGKSFDFEKADSHDVEQKIDSLRDVAAYVIENAGSFDFFHSKLATVCKS